MATKERLIIESMFQIPDKAGLDVPFHLNEVQATLDTNLTGRDIIPKMRQPGVSSYFLARYTAACLSQRNVRAVVISHEADATQRLLMRARYFLENLRGPKAVIKNMSRDEITFPKTNSMFYIGTAGAKTFGRGDTITHLHCSEVAFWPHAKKLMSGLLQAVPRTGEIALESTGNGKGDYYHQRTMNVLRGKSQYRVHFFGWLFTDEYRYDLSPKEEKAFLAHLDPDLKEDELIKIEGIDAGRLAWRRDKLEELEYDLRLFDQEYPLTLDDCFQGSGSGIFYKVRYVPTKLWTRVDNSLWLLEGHPRPESRYAIGADVGGGLGGDSDSSAAVIIDLETCEQVGEWVSNKVEPDRFGSEVLKGLGEQFNGAYIGVESNNHGILTLAKLLDSYPNHLIHKSDTAAKKGEEVTRLVQLGFRTTSRSKPFLIGNLRMGLASYFTIHSMLLMDQLDSFVEKEGGKLEAQEGCHDDLVIAAAMAEHVRGRATMLLVPNGGVVPSLSAEHDPFSLEGILASLPEKESTYPIASHARSASIQPGFEDIYSNEEAIDLLGFFE